MKENVNDRIRIGIVGYGNLGKGVESAIWQNSGDMELKAVFTRRDPKDIIINTEGVKVLHIKDAAKFKNDIDVMILCGGSATDLPEQGPEFASMFNTIDSFDTHARIPEYFEEMDKIAAANKKISIISVGWDPGMFSLNRLLAEAMLPEGKTYTFWGKGISQGHSDAIRRVKGVKDGKQYTIPVEKAVLAVRSGSMPELATREKHTRECFVVPEEGADLEAIEKEIKGMSNYFSDYDTTVHFITEEELKRDHGGMSHGGFVIRSGRTGGDDNGKTSNDENKNTHIIEYSIKLDSNPEFTSSILVCYARAAYRLAQKGDFGAKTVFDIAPALLTPKSADQIRKELL